MPPCWPNCWTRTLRLKMTATDPAFQRCRLLDLGFCFPLIKCGVCPKQVGKMAFLGAVKSSRQSSHAYYSKNLKGIDQKLRCSDILGQCAFRWVSWKNSVATKKWCCAGLCSKVVSAVGFSEKTIFLESVSFHHEMFDVTSFRLVLGVYIVHVVIFIKTIIKLVQD